MSLVIFNYTDPELKNKKVGDISANPRHRNCYRFISAFNMVVYQKKAEFGKIFKYGLFKDFRAYQGFQRGQRA